MFSLSLFSFGKIRKSFRNNKGHALAHSGGGHKRRYILVNFKDSYWHMNGFVLSLHYDPNRSARLALVSYPNGVLSYILAPSGLCPGSVIYSGFNTNHTLGSRFYLWQYPLGTRIYNLEQFPGCGGALIRSAGTFGVILRKTSSYVVVKLPSGEVKMFNLLCLASKGSVSNGGHKFKNWGKAGASRWRGVRPSVRGVAKNPVDHPHGGGEGKTSGGRPSVTPWGKITKGQPTRNYNSKGFKNILTFRNGLKNLKNFLNASKAH